MTSYNRFLSNLSLFLKRACKTYFIISLTLLIGLVVFYSQDEQTQKDRIVTAKDKQVRKMNEWEAQMLEKESLKKEMKTGNIEPNTNYEDEITKLIGDMVNEEDNPAAEVVKKKKPHRYNVLFVVSDDLRPQLNSYKGLHSPNPFSDYKMHTPNLDAFAKRTIHFNKAYVQFSVCSPSRASYMTSRRPDTTKVWDLTTFWRDSGGNFTSIPQYFKENGYRTIGMGKIYHPGQGGGGIDPLSWSEPYYYDANGLFYQIMNDSWWAVPEEYAKERPLHDEDITDAAIRFMEKVAPDAITGEQPFFLALGFQKPHLPFVFPERYLKYYPKKNFELASNSHFPKNFPEVAWFHIEGSEYRDIRYFNATEFLQVLPDEGAMIMRRAYFACVSFVDDMVGRLLKGLHRHGLSENTIVSFIGDHGWHLGENGMWGKHTNMEQATHAPMMIHIPGLTDKGIETDSLVEFVDLFPTLTEAAGLGPIPPCPKNSSDIEVCTEGVSLMPLIASPKKVLKTRVISQMPRYRINGYTIRTNRYRYVEWVGVKKTVITEDLCSYTHLWDKVKGKELYDHKIDPEENDNAVDKKDYREEVKRFSEEIRQMVDTVIYAHCHLV